MEAEGRRPEAGELAHFNFMTRRIDAFDRNEVDPDNLKRIIDDLMKTRVQERWFVARRKREMVEKKVRAERFNLAIKENKM